MSKVDRYNVYFYALYDANKRQPHSGLVAAVCKEAAHIAITDNFTSPRYVTVHRVLELVGIVDDCGKLHIMKREDAAKERDVISCETCGYHGSCKRNLIDGLECCMDWQKALGVPMMNKAKQLISALRGSYDYSSLRDSEAANMIENLSAQCAKQRKECDKWKLRAEAAEKDLHSIIRYAEDRCKLCTHYRPCHGKDCPQYVSGVGATGPNGKEYPDFKWSCEDFDYGTCPAMEDTPCNGCDFENNWQWRGPCEEKEGTT